MIASSSWHRSRVHWLAAAASVLSVGLAFGSCAEDEESTAPPPSVGGGGQGGEAGSGGAEGGSGGSGGGAPFGDPEVLADGQDHPTRIELDADRIYYTAPAHVASGEGGSGGSVLAGAVMAVAKEGGDPERLATVADQDVTALALDGTSLYFSSVNADNSTGTISVVPVAGGAPTDVSSAAGRPGDLAVGESSIYWSYVGQGSGIWQAPKIGGAAETLYYEEGALVTFLWLAGTELYFVNTGTGPQTGAIGVIALGSGLDTLLAEQLARPYYAVGDADYLFFSTSGDGRIRRLARENATITSLASGQEDPYGVALDELGVYWTNRAADGSTEECTNSDGSVAAWLFARAEVTVIATGLSCPMGIAVDEAGVYWVNHGVDDDHDSGSVMWAPRL
jgi:hypothetical protein